MNHFLEQVPFDKLSIIQVQPTFTPLYEVAKVWRLSTDSKINAIPNQCGNNTRSGWQVIFGPTVSKAVLEKPGRRGRLSCMRCV